VSPEEIEAMMRKAQQATPVVIRSFTADYESTCSCGEVILPGDEAGYIDGDTVASCSDCCDDAVST
jgi:hypothetical protein